MVEFYQHQAIFTNSIKEELIEKAMLVMMVMRMRMMMMIVVVAMVNMVVMVRVWIV